MKGLELLLIIERPFLVHYFLSLIDTLDSIHQTIFCLFRDSSGDSSGASLDPIKIAWVEGFAKKSSKIEIPNLSKLKQIAFGLDVPNIF